jgi:hypothetical protein
MRALGLRVKSGSAIIAVIDGEPTAWRVVHCGQVLLTVPAGPYARFPYHPLIEMDAESGRAASREAVAIVRSESRKQLGSLLKSLAPLDSAGVVAGSATDPNRIFNPHIRAHARESQLFREVVITALDRAQIPYQVLRDKEALREFASKIRTPEPEAWEMISRGGQGVVKPWRIDEKLAALGGLYALKCSVTMTSMGMS